MFACHTIPYQRLPMWRKALPRVGSFRYLMFLLRAAVVAPSSRHICWHLLLHMMNKAGVFVYANTSLISEVPCDAFLRRICVWIALLFLVLCRRRCRYQRGINDCPCFKISPRFVSRVIPARIASPANHVLRGFTRIFLNRSMVSPPDTCLLDFTLQNS